MRVCDLEHRRRHCAALTGYNLNSNLTWRGLSVDRSGSHFFHVWISVVFCLRVFFNVGLTKKSLAADKSKITHSNRRLPNIVSIDKYRKYFSEKKKGKKWKKPCCIYAVVSLHCPLRRHVPFFPFIDSRCRVTQRNANWPSVLCCVFVKKENVDSLKSYMILFVFWFSVWHMPRWRPQSYKGTGEGSRKRKSLKI